MSASLGRQKHAAAVILAERQGISLQKSRKRKPERYLSDLGGYRIVAPYQKTIGAQERFDMSLDDVGNFLAAQEEWPAPEG